MKVNNILTQAINNKSTSASDIKKDAVDSSFSKLLSGRLSERDDDQSKKIDQTDSAQQTNSIEQSMVKNRGSLKTDKKDLKLLKLSKELESIFVGQMLKAMRKTVEKTDLMNGGTGEEIFTEMLDTEYSGAMSSNTGFGLAEQIYRQLSNSDSNQVSQAVAELRKSENQDPRE